MPFENLICEVTDHIAVVTVNRPEKLNALNRETLGELRACFDGLAADAEVRAVILTGAGEKAFVAGAEIGEMADLTPMLAEEFARRGQELTDHIENLGKPVIAAINGFALGGGCELAMACTFRYAADTAKLGLPETGLGLIPGYGGTQRMARLVGRGRAMELVLTGDMIDADTAQRIGLVNRVVPAGELLEIARKAAGRIAAKSRVAVRAALTAVGAGLQVPLAEGMRLEAAQFGICASSEDAGEGCTAFVEKRKPVFRDR